MFFLPGTRFLHIKGTLVVRPTMRVPNRFFGIQDFPCLKLAIRDSKAKSGRDSGLKVCLGGEMPKTTLGITGLHEISGRDHGIEEPDWGPSTIGHYYKYSYSAKKE